MAKQTSRRTCNTLTTLALSVVLGGACGGRAVSVEEGSPAGGAMAAGGRPNGGPGSSGKGGGASAGAPSAGAGNQCVAACPEKTCDPGSSLVTRPGECCPVCQSLCPNQVCALSCPMGFQLETPPGQCCASCVPLPMLDCVTGRMNYLQLRDTLLSKYASGCNTAADCEVIAPSNGCELGCGYVAVASSELQNLISNLASDAWTDCAACDVPLTPPCDLPAPVVCLNGQCSMR
jgi:hypothetical protein